MKYIDKWETLRWTYKGSKRVILGGLCIGIMQTSCKKFVQVDPPVTAISSPVVYSNDLSAASAQTSIYDNMMTGQLSDGATSISCLIGLAADELTNYNVSSPVRSSCYTNTLTPVNMYFWPELYQEIFVANRVLEGLSSSSSITQAEKQQLTGEARFMRAFLHFYGTNLYGDIPLVTTSNYEINNTIHPSSQLLVYQQIIADLKDAQSLLPDNFVTPTGQVTTKERVRPNKGAATALLARAYLYKGSWDSAEAQATAVINNTTSYSLLSDLDGVFLKNSSEAIWQLQPVIPDHNTLDGDNFILLSAPSDGGTYPVALDSNLVHSFDSGDNRLAHWVGSFTADDGQTYYFPYKYKASSYSTTDVLEYLMVLRLAEQYLIRAEARAQQGNLSGAADDLNAIRTRAGLAPTTAATQTDLLTAILHERKLELFTEWGHRWFDLKRTNNINPVMSVVTPIKGGSWNSDWALFPIPSSEIIINPNLKQNPGYGN